MATDSCEGAGLIAPPFSPEIERRLRELVPVEVDPGTSVRNPVDSSASGWDPNTFSQVLKTVAGFEGIDFILAYTRVTFGFEVANRLISSLIETKQSVDKPIIMVMRQSGEPEVATFAFGLQQRCHQAGIPTFLSFRQASHAISKFIQYYEVKV